MNLKKYLCHLLFGISLILLSSINVMAQNGHYVGGDISMLPEYEKSNTVYLDGNGNKINDLIAYLRTECGWNSFRVRLFVNPKAEAANARTGIVQNLDYVKELGKRIKDAGANFMLDFHYSDSWADPTHQALPSAWADCTTAALKAKRVGEYTRNCLQQLKAAGAEPDFVQVGNEISYGMVGIQVHPYSYDGDDWDGFISVLSEGCKAVREECPQAKIVIHTERSGNSSQTAYYYSRLKDAGLDYDVIGLSYYPFYHGQLSSLKATLNILQRTFADKKVQIVETAYPIQWWPGDASVDTRSTWPVAEGKCEGQYAFVKDLLATLTAHTNVDGLYYWFPEEAGNGDSANWDTGDGIVISGWLNRGLWWPTVSGEGHWPLKASEGGVLWLLKSFLAEGADGITLPSIGQNTGNIYNLNGQRVTGSFKGVYVSNGRKVVRK